MEFFEKIGDKISSKGKDVAKKAKDLTEIAKLNTKLHGYEDRLKEIQLQIGKKYFEDNKNNPTPEFMELFQQVINAQGAIDKCKEEIASIKGIRTCTKCGADIPNNSTFCPSCGTKSEIIDMPLEVSSTDELFCPQCGISLPTDTAFCSNCGTKVNE